MLLCSHQLWLWLHPVINNYKKDFTGLNILFKIFKKYNPDLIKTQDYKQKQIKLLHITKWTYKNIPETTANYVKKLCCQN